MAWHDARLRRIYLRRRAVALSVVVALVALVAARLDHGSGAGAPTRPGAALSRGPDGYARRGAVRARGSSAAQGAGRTRALPLSLDQLAGQRVIYAYSGLMPPASLLRVIRAGEAAGVILFAPNVTSVAQLRAVVDELQGANARSPVRAPLLILTDQEGGEVRRLPGAPELSEREIGQSADGVSLAGQAGTGAARDLLAAGVNVNLSPVLDVMRAPGGFIDQFHRSYGSDPEAVGRLGSAFITASQRLGVVAAAKHFPGLGAARLGQDTDSRPVTLRLPLATLRGVEEAPYRRAIAAGVKLVMTSWAMYPALAPGVPAGLSARVIEGELRGRLGYRGVTISDTLSAAALATYGSLPQRAVLAARAGADVMICSAIDGNDDPSDGLAVMRALARAIARGQLSRAAAESAAARVLGLRTSLGAA